MAVHNASTSWRDTWARANSHNITPGDTISGVAWLFNTLPVVFGGLTAGSNRGSKKARDRRWRWGDA